MSFDFDEKRACFGSKISISGVSGVSGVSGASGALKKLAGWKSGAWSELF